MNQKTKALVAIHLAVFLWGFTGILGYLIPLSAVPLVWWRLLICIAVMLPLCGTTFIAYARQGSPQFKKAVLMGVLLALHWITFYGSLKLANVSVAVVCLSATAFFTCLFEYFYEGKPIRFMPILISLIAILGIFLMFEFEISFRLGIFVGVVSSIFNAILPVINKKIIPHLKPLHTLFIELLSGLCFLTLWILVKDGFQGFQTTQINPNNFLLLCILVVLCTVIPFYLSFYALQYVAPFTENVIVNLEPVYTVIMAFLFFGEGNQVGFGFYVGVLLILISVVIQMIVDKTPKA